MINFHKQLTHFHDEEVTLPVSLQEEMRERRATNRARLDDGLDRIGCPRPFVKITQGSYPMKTMVQDDANDYDIDDGIYYKASQIIAEFGHIPGPESVRQMVFDALSHDGRLNHLPKVKPHCVRVDYDAGYHIDIPIYKTDESGNNPQLAGPNWTNSNAREVNEWFDRKIAEKSPEEQLRRVVRLLKKFTRSRTDWKDIMPSGFAVTILVCEQFRLSTGRDDISLYETMRKIYERLLEYQHIDHPTTPGSFVNKDGDEAMMVFREKIYENLKTLETLLDGDCDVSRASDAWNKFYNTEFFSSRISRNRNFGTNTNIVPFGANTNKIPSPGYWSGTQGIAVVRQKGRAILESLPSNLPHVAKPTWNIVGNMELIVGAAYESNFGKTQFSNGEIIPKGVYILFSCMLKSGSPIPQKDFYVKWQVVNTCDEAALENCMRGGFENSDPHAQRTESTKYCGIHWVEAFLIRKRDHSLCGRSGRFFVVVSE